MASIEVEELRFLQNANGHRTPANSSTNRRTRPVKKRGARAEAAIEESLSSAVLASGGELARFDPDRAVSLGELMSQADRAMYEQKRKQVDAGECPAQMEEEVGAARLEE